ncbi:MAG: RHS repeat-associated core domain-containing protein, partial [Proteobacteria bacterium]
MPAQFMAQALAAPTDETILYYHNDYAGSSSAITNKDGVVVQRTILKPFGERWDHAGLEKALANSRVAHLFQGLERDPDTGLDQMGARMYDSSIGQFISRDPLMETNIDLGIDSPNELSLYAFAKNNPLRFNDPTGLSSESDDDEDSWAMDASDYSNDGSDYPEYDNQGSRGFESQWE